MTNKTLYASKAFGHSEIAEVFAKRESLAFPAWTADTVNLLRTELDPAGSRHYLVGTAKIGGG